MSLYLHGFTTKKHVYSGCKLSEAQSGFGASLASSHECGLNIKTQGSFFPLRKGKLLLNTRECISDMAYCLVCYNYKQKQL